MKNQIKAAEMLQAALSGLKEAIKTADPAERRVLRASASEVEDVLNTISQPVESEVLDEVSDELAEDDAELAMASLSLAQQALTEAAAEGEDPGEEAGAAADEEEAAEDEDMGEEEEGEAVEEEAEAAADEEEASEDEEEEDMGEEEEGEDDGEEVDVDEDEEDMDLEGELSDEELKALEAEGLLEAKAQIKRLARVHAALKILKGSDEAPTAPAPVAAPAQADETIDAIDPFEEELMDADGALTTAEYVQLLASMDDAERREFREMNKGEVLSAKKMSKAAYAKMKRRAVRNRRMRKIRGPMQKSAKGKPAAIRTKGGGKKKIRKKFFFNTYDNKGKFLGSFWFRSAKPNKDAQKAYQEKYKVKHPAALPIKKKEQVEKLRPKKK